MVPASRSYVVRVTITQHDWYLLRVTSKVWHLRMGVMPAQDDTLPIMVYLLTNHDFKFPQSVTERPVSITAETHLLPNRDAKIELKGRF